MGDPFFVQIPSIDKWSNMTVVLFQPTGFIANPRHGLVYFVRIYTTDYGINDRIQLDTVNIMASQFQRIDDNTNYYYYETQISNESHRISIVDSNVNYSVSWLYSN